MADPFKVAAEIALADVVQNEGIPEGGYTDIRGGFFESNGIGALMMNNALGTEHPKYTPETVSYEDMITAMTANLREDYTGLSNTFAVAHDNGDVSTEDAINALSELGKNSLEMTAKDLQNALDGMKAMGIDPSENSEAIIGMARLIKSASQAEHRLQSGGWKPEPASDPANKI